MSREAQLYADALTYHQQPKPGKLAIEVTKSTKSQRDLALAYSPGVAAPVREIARDPQAAYQYTAKSNLIGVISNGTAVLGLGDVGPLASKPVMEGKGVLFKAFADIDVFDIEVDAADPQAFIDTVARIAPTFGGINLEDIKGPQCFEIEEALKARCQIPIFHDDQHGTAIIVAAALKNALEIQRKSLENVSIVCLGAGAAGIASMRLLMSMGVKREQITMVDSRGVVHTGRTDLNTYKLLFAKDTDARTLAEAVFGADVFIGVAGGGLLTEDMLTSMAERPIVFALSNPDPEIHPDTAKAVRQDLIMATGRSDFHNQVNNVLCFPYIFRGALDVRAETINTEMMIAAVEAIRDLAKAPLTEAVKAAYPEEASVSFGPDYILPKPLDARLKQAVSLAVAKAAIETGVASIPLPSHYDTESALVTD